MFFKTNKYSEEKAYLIMAITNYIEKEKCIGFLFLFPADRGVKNKQFPG